MNTNKIDIESILHTQNICFTNSDKQNILGELYNENLRDLKAEYKITTNFEKTLDKQIVCYINMLFLKYGKLFFEEPKTSSITKNNKVSFKYFQRSAIMENSKGQYNLALSYYYGIGIKQNLKLALKYLKKSSQQNNPKAQYALAIMYLFEEVEFYVINSDESSLKRAKANNKILIGYDGFGCGGDTTRAKRYLEQSNTEIKNILKDTNLLILTTGMGGGIGTAAVCEIAKMAKEQNIPTIAVISIPFTMEGLSRTTTAENGIKELNEYTSAIFVFKNDDIFNYIFENAYFDRIFGFIDGIIIGIINSIIKTISNNDTVGVGIDIYDLILFIKDSKQVMLKKGIGSTIKGVFNNAIENNICKSFDISKAEKILLTVIFGTKPTISDMRILNNEIKNKFPNSKFCKVQILQQSNISAMQIIMILSC